MITIHNAQGVTLYTFDGDEDSLSAAVEAAIEEKVELAGAVFAGLELSVREARFMSTRTLQRRLGAEGHSYAQVLDQLREALARQLVAAHEPSLSEVAFQLGFAELSTFSRAFKRWTGSAPGAFRDGRN